MPGTVSNDVNRAAANIIDARKDDAVAHDLDQHRRVELGAVEFAEQQGEVGVLRVPGDLELPARASTRTGGCGPHTANFPAVRSAASHARCGKRAQLPRRLLERQTPVVEHEQRSRAWARRRQMIEVGVLIRMQPHHIDRPVKRARERAAMRRRRSQRGHVRRAARADPARRPVRQARRMAARRTRNAGCRCT